MDTYTDDFYDVTEYLGGFPSENEVVRARHVIIQHAKVYIWLVTVLVGWEKPPTEDLLEQRHSILCMGEDGVSPSWRVPNRPCNRPIRSKLSKEVGVRAAAVGPCIHESSGFTIQCCHVFVNIHQFEDGNGRMCCMLLDVILLKFLGVCVAIGEGGGPDRADYLTLTNRAGRIFFGEAGTVSGIRVRGI